MVKCGAIVAIIQDGKILLTKRQDFEVWCLPGGHVDPWESVADAAKRESVEETGLEVELTRFIGVYSRLGGEHTIHLNLFCSDTCRWGTQAAVGGGAGTFLLCPGCAAGAYALVASAAST